MILDHMALEVSDRLDKSIDRALKGWWGIDLRYVLSNKDKFRLNESDNIYTLYKNHLPLISYRLRNFSSNKCEAYDVVFEIWRGGAEDEPD